MTLDRPPCAKATVIAALLFAVPAGAAQAAPLVRCHVDYGGERQSLVLRPTHDPYAVAPLAIGSYFLFRAVFEHPARALPGIKLTTYADREDGPVPIHVAHYPWPVARGGRYGFTGEQFVYEPVRDGELRYWCERPGRAAPVSRR